MLPAMVLRAEAVRHNLEVMADLAAREGLKLAPHGKTTMCPELFEWQLEAGAWGITVANVTQAQVAVDAGARRVLIANEVLGVTDARWLASAASSVEVYSLVDSVAGVELLDAGLRKAECERPVSVLVEVGVDGARAGVRSRATARDVARAVQAATCLELVGVEGYEGSVGSDRSPGDLAAVDRYLDSVRAVAVDLADAGAFHAGRPVLVSAGGSKYFDRVISALGRTTDFGGHETSLVLRSGCYLVHDHGIYARSSPFGDEAPPSERLRPAIQIWAEVLSRPEPALAIVGLGRRDASFDSDLPVALATVPNGSRAPLGGPAGRLVKLDDQHGYLALNPAITELGVGDRIVFGISHPCTTFDKWRRILLVNDEHEVIRVLHTRFH